MSVPIRCMSCGKVIADKWRYYQHRVQHLQAEKDESGKQLHPSKFYTDGKQIPKTAECVALDELGMTRWCCRTALLTHVDIHDKY